MRKIFALMLAFVLVGLTTVAMAEEPLISRGDYNENVITLHQKLGELGLYSLRAESPWSSASEDALRILQGTMGLEETGTAADQGELDKILSFEHEPFSMIDIAKSRIVENLYNDVQLTDGAQKTDSGYEFTTNIEDNRFGYTVWQVYEPDGYLENITTGEVGITEGDYVFPYESGEYRIVFKGNTNLKDEGLTATLQLEKDKIYHYVSVVDLLEPQRVVVKDVAFGLRK
ncbi:MAG: hypothetical protein IJ757_00965 [Clostridiales bacterium]|nr:hypothetical protein [Clostridiales bacterium]